MATLTIRSVERLSDLETPVSAYLKLCRGLVDSFLLESVETKDVTGRYSVVAFDPILVITLEDDRVVKANSGHGSGHPAVDFFPLVREELENLRCGRLPGLPAVGCLVGHVGYDAVRLIERLPNRRPSEFPAARLVFPSRFVVFDQLRRVMVLLAIDTSEGACESKIREMDQALRSPLTVPNRRAGIGVVAPDREHYIHAVRTAQEYIRNGDIFQVVLSDSFHGETDLEPFSVYRRLRVRSPSPYMFFLDFGGYQLVGSSPETLVKV
ncbi:MAG: chorismate-binding protein, partial [Deltaproteobacteria bacterium]|nr:chorismate-binding protein [Deltaproteobacteria bacterium]